MNLIAIDPGLISSGTGIAYFENNVLLKNLYVAPLKEYLFKKSAENVVNTIIDEIPKWCNPDTIFLVETNRYMGKANLVHLKLLGALDYMFNIETIHAMTVKKQVCGNGRATKSDIKQKLQQIYAHQEFFDRILWQHEDAVDAVAIGLAYINKMKG